MGVGVPVPGKDKLGVAGQLREKIESAIELFVGVVGVVGKRGPLLRRKIKGVWTAGLCRKLFEFGEPI